jgi:hypothetical protein
MIDQNFAKINLVSLKFFFMDFKILQTNFRNYFERQNAEAFFIIIFKHTLADQCKNLSNLAHYFISELELF